MTNKTFADPAVWMVHDMGPQRFASAEAGERGWGRSKLGRVVLEEMRHYGLDERDAFVSASTPVRVSTDAGVLDLRGDFPTDDEMATLRGYFAQVAFGVAQERIMRLSGWRPQHELPFWAVTLSDVLARRLAEHRVTPTQLWNAGVNVDDDGWFDRRAFSTTGQSYRATDPRAALPADCYVARYGTGMHFSWAKGELDYSESQHGAHLTLPATLLPSDDSDTLVGRRLGDVLRNDGELSRALADFEIIAATPALSPGDLTLRLAVGMRTLQPIPSGVLDAAGVQTAEGVEADRPLWMYTDPGLILSYRPRLPKTES